MGFKVEIGGVSYEMESFNVSEASTPLSSDDSRGEVGTISLSLKRPDPFLTSASNNLFAKGAHLLLGESVRLTDSKKGFTLGTVKTISDNSGALVNVTAESRIGLLNVYDIQAQPFIGRLDDLFDYYMSLAGITTDVFIDPSIAATSVVFPGWFGELWFNLKRLAASIGAEISLVSGIILLRPVRTREAIRGRDVSRSFNAGGGQLAQSVEVVRYDNQQITNQLVYPIGGWNEEVAVINVNAGEYVEQVLELSASVSSIQQPVMQTFVAKDYSASSVFTVVGDDGLPIPVAQWNDNGGSLSVAINDDTISLTVKIQAPTNITNQDGDPISVYSISLSSDDSAGRYSTLRIVGSGVAFNKTTFTFPTGLTAQQTATKVGVTIDNPFLSSLQEVYNAGTKAAKRYTGSDLNISGDVISVNRLGDSGSATYPTYSFVQTQHVGKTYAQVQTTYSGQLYSDIQSDLFDLVQNDFENQVFGNVAGARVWDSTSKRYYRIREATLNPGTISFSAEDDLLYSDMQTFHTGSTYANLQTKYSGRTYFKVNLMGMG